MTTHDTLPDDACHATQKLLASPRLPALAWTSLRDLVVRAEADQGSEMARRYFLAMTGGNAGKNEAAN